MKNKPLLGAIRWDAWYGHNANDTNILLQVEKSLSPKEYHFRAPFFSTVTEDGKIYIPQYTFDTFEKEMEYAVKAQIDYFAYVWYDGAMGICRRMHGQSKYRNQVKLCPCLDGNAINKEYARNEISELLEKDFFMTVLDGRPLMYYFGNGRNQADIQREIAFYKDVCRKKNIPEPYAVIMNNSWGDVLAHGGDAVSKYAVGAQDGLPFAGLMDKTRKVWEWWLNDNGHIVPIISAGWHSKTRYDNPVKWMTVPENSWGGYATGEQIAELTRDAFDFIKEHPENCEANTAIIYAWNEHDEGGWICPTIAVDGNGKQIMNSDGTPRINDERIKALAAM